MAKTMNPRWKIAIRPAGSRDYEPVGGTYDSEETAVRIGTDKITNTQFDSFQVWELVGTYEAEHRIIQTDAVPSTDGAIILDDHRPRAAIGPKPGDVRDL